MHRPFHPQAVGVGGDRFHIDELNPAIRAVLYVVKVSGSRQFFVQWVVMACMVSAVGYVEAWSSSEILQ